MSDGGIETTITMVAHESQDVEVLAFDGWSTKKKGLRITFPNIVGGRAQIGNLNRDWCTQIVARLRKEYNTLRARICLNLAVLQVREYLKTGINISTRSQYAHIREPDDWFEKLPGVTPQIEDGEGDCWMEILVKYLQTDEDNQVF